ncbi:hypothetical protein [Trinickia soli]|uniref:Uncharacterized protein n=1 Tax=Trinickia soli TaxID=380675 RepID=A0A2N7VQ11_9BURK|nr:hypothetical protein [Trinickia soli]PMS19217.1 hypothetical protein C0Z19_21515 [Trinickia soli]CAB3643555.1 hypothetical protein LMG24076_00407 [Trinickia soli]
MQAQAGADEVAARPGAALFSSLAPGRKIARRVVSPDQRALSFRAAVVVVDIFRQREQIAELLEAEGFSGEEPFLGQMPDKLIRF